MKTGLVLIISALVLLCGCVGNSVVETAMTTTTTPSSVETSEKWTISLVISDMIPKELTIKEDGTIQLAEGDNVKSHSINIEEVDAIKKRITDIGFFSMNPVNEGDGCCDFVPHNITVTREGEAHSVYCYNQCPEGFDQLAYNIKSLWPEEIIVEGFA
ncbi:MAG TPA: hypothetical protein ENN13_00295 [Candidatus Altiarchaeales archaeon]|nr:hypothetical protein [Candidatus Altiarchaeales archaeon]